MARRTVAKTAAVVFSYVAGKERKCPLQIIKLFLPTPAMGTLVPPSGLGHTVLATMMSKRPTELRLEACASRPAGDGPQPRYHQEGRHDSEEKDRRVLGVAGVEETVPQDQHEQVSPDDERTPYALPRRPKLTDDHRGKSAEGSQGESSEPKGCLWACRDPRHPSEGDVQGHQGGEDVDQSEHGSADREKET